MPRKHLSVEFLNKLKDLSGHSAVNAFAKACGKKDQAANFTKYLNGTIIPGKKVLSECLASLFRWQPKAIAEVHSLPKPRSNISTKPGIYCFYDVAMKLTYIGKATNLRTEINQTLNRTVPGLVKKKHKDVVRYYSAYEVEDEAMRVNLEAILIRVAGHHTYNDNVPDFI